VELRTYARILLRRWWLPVAFALVAAVVGYGVSAQAAPTFRATSQLSILPSIVDYFTGEAVQRLLNNYSLQLKSRAFAGLAAQRLPTPGRAEDVVGKIKAVAAPAEYRIAIEVDDADPSRARDLANAAATAFVEKIRAENAGREKRDIEVQILDLAEMPGAPISPRPRRNAAGAGILGAGLGIAAAFLLEYVDYHRPQRRSGAPGAPGAPGGTGSRRDPLRRRRALSARPSPPELVAPAGAREGVFPYGLRSRRSADRGDVHQTPLAGGRSVSDATHQPPVRRP
jgi:capsular polysaccharide biosynthesis protein